MKLVPFDTVLKDGSTVRIREIRPDDRHLLGAGYRHLSDRSRRLRFLAAHPTLTEDELDAFSASNTTDHVAVGALTTGETGPEPAGIARFVRLPADGTDAEIAVTIVDNRQGKGLGSLLLGTLAKFAGMLGISEFVALVASDNTAMLTLLERLGGTRIVLDSAEIEIRVPLYRDPEHYPATSVGDAFRKAYRLAKIT